MVKCQKFLFFFVAEYTVSIVKICVSWSDWPLIMEDTEDKPSPLLSTNIISMTVITLLSIFIAKCTGN